MWVEVLFKGKKVWAQVGADGTVVSQSGRTPIRYSASANAKIYNAGTARIQRQPGAAPQELPDGQAAGPSTGRGSGRKGSGFGSAGKRTKAQAASAKKDARSRIAALDSNTHVCFTDGACKGNPGPAGAGAVVKLADGTVLEDSRHLGIATNNVGELTAIDMALDLLSSAGVPQTAPVALFTDSKYALGVLTQGWKAKANQSLIRGIKERLAEWPNFDIQWVAGHVGLPENERADALAVAGCENRSLPS